jgi:hypothetical protein
MTMNSEVFRAILAMDSYNRGYGANVNIQASLQIGLANIIQLESLGITESDIAGWQSVGFYASAYSWNGETVISYRGTNPDFGDSAIEFVISPAVRDIWNGWGVGAGFAGGSQAGLALSFYRAVAGVDSAYYRIEDQPNVTLTGHSLGGGLAGFVGALSGQVSWGYDHMPFGIAAYAQAIADSATAAAATLGLEWEDVAAGLGGPSTALISGITSLQEFLDEYVAQFALRDPAIGMNAYSIEGEVLAGIRDGTLTALLTGVTGGLLGLIGGPLGVGAGLLLAAIGFGTALTTAEIENGIGDFYYPAFATGEGYRENLTAVERHSMPLLVMSIYGREQWAGEGRNRSQVDWDTGFEYVAPSLFSREIAFNGLNLRGGRNGTGAADPASQMATMIAYSAINEGTRVFGDTAIRALSDDAANLGRALNGVAPEALRSGANGVGAVVTEYAGLLAVQETESANYAAALDGVLTYRNATAARSATLMIDLREATWDYERNHTLVSKDNMIEGFFEADIANGRQLLNHIERFFLRENGTQILPAIDRVSIALSGSQPPARLAGDGVLLTVLSDQGNVTTQTARTDFVIGGQGNDEINGIGGHDILIGGGGLDMLNGGAGNDFLYGGTGADLLYGGQGRDELWSGPATDGASDENDILYGDEGNDRLIFSGGYGVAIGGLGNDVIDVRRASGFVTVQYYSGDGTDRLLRETDPSALTFDDPGFGRFTSDVVVNFNDFSLDDVRIVWSVTIVSERSDPFRDGWVERICSGTMRVYDLNGQELMNLGTVTGIVGGPAGAGLGGYFCSLDNPQLTFVDGIFEASEGANVDFQIMVAAPDTPPADSFLTSASDAAPLGAFVPAQQTIPLADFLFIQ